MSTNDHTGARRLSHRRPVNRGHIPREKPCPLTPQEINRECRLEAIEINLRHSLKCAELYLAAKPRQEVAMLAIELAKLRGDNNPFRHCRDAAALLTEASSAIAYERDGKKREQQEAQEKYALALCRQMSDKPHPYKPGELVNPDDFVPYALFVSDGSNLEGLEPPCKMRNGKKPPVPWYKTDNGFLALLRKVVIAQRAKAGEEVTADEIEEIASGILAKAKAGKMAVLRYQELLFYYHNDLNEKTEPARAAKAAKAAEKRAAKEQAKSTASKPVKRKRSQKPRK